MRRAIDETDRRREKQVAYNEKHNITPKQIVKSLHAIMGQTSVVDQVTGQKAYIGPDHLSLAADPVVKYMNKDQLQKSINQTRKAMEKAAKELNFIEAARLRDEMFALQELFKNEA